MNQITVNPNRIDLDEAYLQMAEIWAKRSKANRLQVGALIVREDQIISDGYNGMPSGWHDDRCEVWGYPLDYDGQDGLAGPPDKIMITKPEVLHAESNALSKIAKKGGVGAEGGTLYVTDSPCPDCAKFAKQCGIVRVVFRKQYRLLDGIKMLEKLGIKCEQLKG